MFRPWLAAIRAAATPLLMIAAAALVGLSAAMISISAHESDVRDRIERAADRAEQTGREQATHQLEGTLARTRAELEDVRTARDVCYAAADGAAPVIYGYYASTDDERHRYAGWLPTVERCRDLAEPASESAGAGDGFQRATTAVGGGR